LKLSGSRDAANDLIQSCVVKALSSLSPPSDALKIRAWLFSILRNSWIDGYRHGRIVAEEQFDEHGLHSAWNFDDKLIAELTVKQAFARLEPTYREVVELVDIAGFRYAEAAVILKIPIGTVMSRLSRARLEILANIEIATARSADPEK